jgi:serine/threonine-protein kinase
MTPERRKQIEALFEAALERPPAQRSAWLAGACEGDEELGREVAGLLAAHERSGGLLEADAVGAAAAVIDADAVPERIGPYRIDSVIGRGGMGVVYLAERDDGQFRRRVAIKLIRGGPGLDELQRRFEVERQVLASLDHPNIAGMLDGGVTQDGLPYLVMEYADGLPIDEYCRENSLDIVSILELFRTVARAVHHAHRNLVVHRDIKPSNIFVTADGVVKLLDFGIAKMLDPSNFGHTSTITRTGLRLMTPAYASPEQISGDSVTTATDVYGLGVVLYELLTDRLPFSLDGCSPAECERIIISQEPRRPSSVVAEAANAARLPARRFDGQRWLRRLRGDLDRIVLTALRKEPGRRYASAEQLAEDIERHIKGLPVMARSDSAAYRARKFVARHRWGVVAAVLVLASLVSGALATAWQARRASRQAAIASAQRDRAAGEADKAARVAGLMLDLFRLSDPNQTLGDTITARQVLDRGAERIEREFSDQPEIQAELLLEVARVYSHLGLLDRAETLVRRSLELREARYGPSDLEVSASLCELGEVLAALGRRREAIGAFRRAIVIREAILDAPDTTLARAQASLAWQVRAEGQHDRAAELFRRALDTQINLLGDESPQVASTMLGLASAYHDRGSFDEAEALFESALARYDAGSAKPHPLAATALLNIGMLRRLKEEYRTAEPILESAVKMHAALYDPDHHQVIEAQKEWGQLLYYLGRYGEAERVLADALERASRTLGPDHDNTVTLREALAITLTLTGRYGAAMARHDSALVIKRAKGPGMSLLATETRYGQALLESGRLDEANARFAAALEMTSANSVYRIIALRGTAMAAQRQRRYEDAARQFEEALAIAAERLRPSHRYTLATQRAYACLLIETGRYDEAASLLEQVLAHERRKFREPHPDIGYTLHYLGEAYLLQGNPFAAETTLRLALRNYAELPASHWQVGDATSLLGSALRAQGQSSANVLLEDGLRIVRGHVGLGTWQARRAEGRL